ncbi:MAG: CHAT domain-containing protein [Geobacter sp.]|nr:CHAT domain-containing protein [Geobacter sp.]
MAPKLKIPGTAGSISAKSDELDKVPIQNLPFSIKVQEVVDVASAREAGDAVTVELAQPLSKGEQRNSGQVCEVELEGGITLWLRPGSLYRDFGTQKSRGVAGEEDIWEISPSITRRDAARGGPATLGVRKLTVYQWQRTADASAPPPQPAKGKRGARGIIGTAGGAVLDTATGVVGGLMAVPVGRAVEQHLLKGNEPGLYKVELKGDFSMELCKELKADGPVLLFLHGTISSFEGSFKGLWDVKNGAGSDARAQFARRYGCAYAYEHYTLTESPIINALTLVKQLPDGTRLHLVSHSRGGLVGDLLCLGQRVPGTDPLSLTRIAEIFVMAASNGKSGKQDQERKNQAAQLIELIDTLEKKKITVERFVRVACPARGTTLASGKLDRWLSVVKLLNDLVLPFNFPLQLLIGLIAEHDDPSQLPGLEAMMPGSPLVRILNFPALEVKSDLSVISGDTEGKGLFGRLKELMLDQFFEDECDIVVNTGAMFGGLKRQDGGRFHLDCGPEVNHFSYFTNDETVRMLAAGLLRSDSSDGGFRPISLAPEKEPARAILRRAPQGPLPVVFVLPGIMGSTLEVNGDCIWLGKLALMFGKFGKLEINRDVTPKEPFEEYYGELIGRLRETHEVIPFAYDWRRSIMNAGEILANQIGAKLDEIEQRGSNMPVRILAHSMGGLVVRAMIAKKPEVWRRMTAHSGGRLLMLGTPNGGSYEIVRLLTGYSSTLQQLALLDFTRNWKELLEIIAKYPGVLELLPIENDYQFFGTEIWQKLKDADEEMRDYGVELPDAAILQQARQSWEKILSVPLDPERTLYVAGQARETTIGWRAVTEQDPEHIQNDRHLVAFEATSRGDGKVPWDTGIPQNIRTWYLPDVEHGDLPAHEDAFPAYLELLQNGSTARLATTAPAGIRSAALEQRTVMAREIPALLPDERELAGTVLGVGSSRNRKKTKVCLPKVAVSISHGDLGYALHPVIVGHYAGDTIVSAEDYLDKVLDGRLRERHQLGLYPGKLGTCEVVLNPNRYGKPAGAIVIGLGQVGELSPGNLQAAVTQAALQYALHVAECQDERFSTIPGVPRSARITSLLIGTGAGGMTVRDSLEAILRGVAAANKLLYDQKLIDKVRIDAIELTELWQDIAIQAAIELGRVMLDGAIADLFVWREQSVKNGEGGRRRVQLEEASNWWQRMEIIHDKKKDELRFIALTDRARAEESLVTGQLRLAEDLIRQTISDTTRDTKVTHALFEMLIPNRIKELAPNQLDVVLVVDEVSGGYPWELLEDRWSSGDRPVAVSSGMLRQFKTGVFREHPVTTLEDTVYVVGDPLITGDAARMFPSLEGARKEAVAVADFLQQNGFNVTRQIRSDARDILAGLHDNGYRVLHLAGHGVHEEELPVPGSTGSCESCKQPLATQTRKFSGMVIGDNIFLTPGDVEQMRWVPELVFINCCHLGNVTTTDTAEPQRSFHRLAANIAAQFIEMGVKAVVAAGWAVDDAAAETFATSFYRQMLASVKFGDAVRAAREETFDRHGTTNTWGAYQCYGDPAFRLRPRKTDLKSAPLRNYVSIIQAVTDLENLASRASSGSSCSGEVETVVQSIRNKDEKWLINPELAAALGLAYGELGLFQQAISHLDVAIGGEKAEFPLLAVEQRANYKSRWAVQLKRSGTTVPDKTPEGVIREAIDDIDRLLKFSETSERLSLMGSAHKRLAWISKGNVRKIALKEMAGFYRSAHDKSYDKESGRLDTYPLLNWLAAEIMLGWYGEKPGVSSLDIKEWCELCRAYSADKERLEPNFWNSVVRPECDLILALLDSAVDDRKRTIVDSYRQAKSRGASYKQFQSVMDHLEFLAEMSTEAGKRKEIRQQASALTEIVEQLAPLGESDISKR